MNIKYIKTEINNNDSIMVMDSCNLCPLLSFDHDTKVVRCLKYNRPYKDIEPYKSNIIKQNTNGYKFSRGIYLPLEKIEIPKWCGLSDNISSIKSKIYVKTGQNKYKYRFYYNKNNTCNYDYQIQNSKDVDYDRCFIKLIKREDKPKRKINTNFKNENNTKPPISHTSTQKILKECSYCGNKDTTVSRNNNMGMCEKCWNLYKENKDKKYLSYINNFRLKRKSTRLEKINKTVGDLNIF
ncbi:MAG: hypothetical protein ACOC3V_01940 [bacterium]